MQEHCSEFYFCLIAIMKKQIKKYARKREHIEQTIRQRTKKKEQQKQIEQKEQKKIEILKIKQRLQDLRQRRIQRKTIEIAKSISTFRDIDIFDSTFICDIQKFELYNQVTNFLQYLEQCQHQYRKSNVLDLLFKCFRNSVFA